MLSTLSTLSTLWTLSTLPTSSTWDLKGSQEISRDFEGSQEISRDLRGSQEITRDVKRSQGISQETSKNLKRSQWISRDFIECQNCENLQWCHECTSSASIRINFELVSFQITSNVFTFNQFRGCLVLCACANIVDCPELQIMNDSVSPFDW